MVTPINRVCAPVTDFQPPIGVEFCEQMNGVSFVTRELPVRNENLLTNVLTREMKLDSVQ